MQNITSLTELNAIIESNEKVLIDFWAPWCGPCRMLGPIIEKVGEEVTDVMIVKVNVDEMPEAASSFDVSSIPQVNILKNGTPAHTLVGVQPQKKYVDLLNDL